MLVVSISGAGLIAAVVGQAGLTPAPGTLANPIKAKDVRGGFLPARVTVRNTRRGVTVYFRSVDRELHNAIPVRPIRGSRETTSRRVFTLRLPASYRGTLRYICTLHTNMRGTLVVTG